MATLNLVVLPAKKLADGSNKVRISLAHNGETKYIVTDIKIRNGARLKGERIIGGTDSDFLTTRIKKILREYQCKLDEIDYTDSLSCGELLSLLKNGKNNSVSTIEEAYRHYISLAHIKKSSETQYSHLWNTLKKGVEPSTQLRSITYATVMKLEKTLVTNKYSLTHIKNIMTMFKTIINNAIKFDFVNYRRHPFLNYKAPQSVVRQNWLTADDIKKIRDYQPEMGRITIGRDLFMLSFYLGGMNAIDIAQIDWEEVCKRGRIKYVREKATSFNRTPKPVEFTMPEEALTIVKSLLTKKSFTTLNLQNYQSRLSYYNKTIRDLGKKIGIENIMFYSARKTFSQIAFVLGVHTQVIDRLLGHTDRNKGSSIYHYIFVTPEMMTDAIRKVLDYIK